MNADKPRAHEHLFTVRFWHEVLDGGRSEWRGRIQHIGSGEARYFRTWRTLIKFIVAMLEPREDEHRDQQ